MNIEKSIISLIILTIMSNNLYANIINYQKDRQEGIKADFKNVNLENHQNLINDTHISLDRKDINNITKSLKKDNIHKINEENIEKIKAKFSDIDLNNDLLYKANQMNKNLFPQLTKEYQSKEINDNNGLIIFLSSSLSANLWQEYQVEIKKYNAKAVIRGMVGGSIKKTIKFVSNVKNRQAGISIDPELFTRFNITKVPAIILYDQTQCQNDECTPNFDKITGTVGVKYFLEKVREDGDLSEIADDILSKSDYR